MKKYLIFFMFSLISLSLSAYWDPSWGTTVVYQGLYFKLYSNDQCTLLAKPKEKYSGDIKIPSKVPYGNTIYKVTCIGSEAFKDCSNLTSVEIPNSVITIDNSAFYGCSALTSVKIPNSVTMIGESAFRDCSSLEKAEFASIESICNISFGGLESNPLSYALHLYINEQEITDLVIPNSVTKIGNYAFKNCSGLTSVVIPNSVTEIGNYAFSGCTGLTSVEIPNSVITIGENSFSSCTGLTSVEIPNSVTVIGNWAFSSCTGLTSVEIPNSVTKIGNWAFSSCTGLTSVEIPNSVTTIGVAAFSGCTGLTSVEIPNSVTKIGNYAFKNCSGLTSVKIPNSVTELAAFSGCTGLTSVEIPNSVTKIGNYAFKNCSGLTSVVIPNSVTEIGNYAFSDCSGLTSVKIPNSVTTIGEFAFSNCSGLTSIFIGNSIQNFDNYIWRNCPNIKDIIYIAKTPVKSYKSIFDNNIYSQATLYLLEEAIPKVETMMPWGWFEKIEKYTYSIQSGDDFEYNGIKYTVIDADAKTCRTKAGWTQQVGDELRGTSGNIISGDVTIPEKAYFDGVGYTVCEIGRLSFFAQNISSIKIPNTVTSIDSYAFNQCTELADIVLSNSLTTIGDFAFYYCSGLIDIVIPNSVQYIGEQAFNGCSKLESVVMPESLKTISFGAFYSCEKLNKITMPNSLTGIDDYAFSYCIGLTDIVIPNSVQYIGEHVFNRCSGLKSVVIPESLKTISAGAFYLCEKLNKITMPNNSIVTLGDLAFAGCFGLENIELPNSLKTIGRGSFNGCKKLKEIDIPSNVYCIGDSAFLWCPELTTITLPASITTFGDGIFNQCEDIVDVYYAAKHPVEGNTNMFESVVYNNATLHMAAQALPQAKAINPWKQFRKIVGIDDNLKAGDDFESNGIIYTVIDPEAKTVKTKDGDSSIPGNQVSGSLSLPQKIDYKNNSYDLIEIGEYSFSNCNQLNSVTIPNSVTVIGNNAFTACSNLKSLKIGDGVKTFGEYIWSQCPDIEVIEYTAKTLTSGDKNIFDDNVYNNATLRLHDSVQEEAANISPWKWFANLEKPAPYKLSYSLSSSEATVTGFTSTVLADVEIPSEYTENGKTYSVTRIAASAFKGSDMLKSVIIPPTITSISPAAFSGCSNLSEVIYNATTVTNVWDHWSSPIFGNCANLTSIKIGQSVKNLPKYIFKTTPISSIVIPDNVTDLEDDCFASCLKLSDITIGKGVEVIKCASFALESGETAPATTLRVNSVNLKSYTGLNGTTSYLPFNNRNVTTIILGDEVESFTGYSFRECKPTVIESHNPIPPSLGYGCFDSTNKKTCALYIPQGAKTAYSTANVWKEFANISDSLSDRGLQAGDDFTYNGITYTVIDPEAKTVKTKDGDSSTAGNQVSGNLVLPENVYHDFDCYTLTEFGDNGFFNCKELTSITIPNSVTKIGYDTFYGCSSLEKAEFASIESICNIKFECRESNPLWRAHHLYIDGEEITNLVIPNSVTEIGNYAFSGCSSLSSVEIPNSTTEIGNFTFSGCSGLISVLIPNSVTEIGYAAFSGCSGLTSVQIPNSVTEIGGSAFSGCSGLTSVQIPNSVTEINYATFEDCSGLTSVQIPNSVTEIGGSAFSGCSGLTSVQIPNSVTEIGGSAFSGCSGLTSVQIPNSVTKILSGAFYGCSAFTSVEIPNSVTKIGWKAFANCSSLNSVSIGHGVQEFNSSIWLDCPNIKDVYYAAEHPAKGFSDTFNDEVYAKATLHIPAEAIEEAKTIYPWRLFKSIEAYDFNAGLSDVTVDEDPDAEVEVYNLSGIKVFEGPRSEIALPRGYYIIIQNGKPTKALLGY